MPKARGNRFFESWDEEAALAFMDEALALIEEDKTLTFIGTLASRLGTCRQRFSYLKDKFSSCKDKLQLIKGILESRTYEKALSYPPATGMLIFSLKNNYGWTDKKEFDHTSKGESINIRQNFGGTDTE